MARVWATRAALAAALGVCGVALLLLAWAHTDESHAPLLRAPGGSSAEAAEGGGHHEPAHETEHGSARSPDSEPVDGPPTRLPPQAKLPGGATVTGAWGGAGGDLARFLGIPYARAKRWHPAEMRSDYPTDVLATEYGPACPQIGNGSPVPPDRPVSEQCLNLDVFVRGGGATPKPVIVWIYGGSLVVGCTTSYAQLEQLADRGDVVLVAMNYRVATLGFLVHPALAAQDPRGTSGNYGLTDQIAALQWVRANVAAFGGDPSNVTLLGQSSGGTSILALLMAPSARGLFHKAISLSASPNITADRAVGERQGEALVAEATSCGDGSSRSVYDCMMALSTEEANALFPDSFSVMPLFPQRPSGQHYPALPIVDGVTLTMPLEEALATALVDVPLILQVMYAEMDTFDPHPRIYDMDAAEYETFLAGLFASHGWQDGRAVAAQLAALYNQEQANSTELAVQAWVADYSFYCAHVQLARIAASAFRSPVYLSLIRRPPDSPLHVFPGQPPSLYSGHMWDYIAATRAWTFFADAFGARPYNASAGDVTFGDVLFGQWMNMTSSADGKVPGLRVASSSHAFPQSVTVNVQSDVGAVFAPVAVDDYNVKRCRALESEPISMGKGFWCVN